MRRLPFIVFLMIGYFLSYGQSPHGDQLKMNCIACHNTEGWNIPADHWNFKEEQTRIFSKTTGADITPIDSSFNHFKTSFPLAGSHENVDCKSCHASLIFEEATSSCIDCHLDVHSMTVGNDCVRCHTAENWLVDDIPEIHEQNGFPLVGNHGVLSCVDCHISETNLKFDRIGNECISCHRSDFDNTTNPNHHDAGFGMDCLECHSPDGNSWDTEVLNHDFFPLTLGHEIQDCKRCHLTDKFSDTSPDCVSCHQTDFDGTNSPNHKVLDFNTDCTQCHTTDVGWAPAQFADHDAKFFPIYSGKHNGVWMECIECHQTPDDFSQFTCISCHINPETDNHHIDVAGYTYEDNACLTCHPTGDADMSFDHNNTNFPLTGSHIGVACLECHSAGYEGTSTNCVDCHTLDFQGSINPNHVTLNLPNDCVSCHTTDPDWMPATFDIHDNFYPLNGAHALISTDCATCHNGDYNNTPNTCVGCHLDDYNATTDPNHAAANFSTDCTTCHTEDSWTPATFDHDAQFFPIYSGKHQGEWTECIDCHTNPSNFQEFRCTNCHINPETDDAHMGVGGYVYEDNACLACHPTGDADVVFDHNATNFPLTGAHLSAECLECHSAGFEGTSTNCVDCHTMDFQGSINPNHVTLNLPNDCVSCHTTDPDWMPATFDIHDTYYALNGAHALIATDCASCHNGDYNNTPNTCVGCHLDDYNSVLDPNHAAANFSTDCTTCHTEDAWTPSTFDHDAQHFPIYSGKHQGEWTECIDCHTNPSNYMEFKCTNCHINPETDDAHLGVGGYVYEDNACLACHPTGDADVAFDHNATNFPLTGAHLSAECLDCHSGGFEGTSTNCVDCHTMDFQGSINPNHVTLNIPTDCASCHTTDPGWMPATFDIHDDYYVLEGAHALIAMDCATCHNGEYNNTPNTCVGCHQQDYDNTMNPNHAAAQFSNDCVTCHGQDMWVPATFDHDAQYFPIYSGKHDGEWTQCIDCHTNPNNFAEFSCINCHINPETDDAHLGVGGYVYEDNACLACHPTGDAGMAFDHNNTNFPLTGAHLMTDCIECHANGYQGTPTDCNSCHNQDYIASLNPNHSSLGLPTDCATCHTTDPGWSPASFDVHDSYYPLTGQHLAIADDCIQCHNGDYNNTPNTCVGCHMQDHQTSVNPNHVTLNIPTDCATCHTTDPDWMPATFDIHDNYYALNGAHALIATDCATCHNGDYNNTPNTCIGCHQSDFDGTTNPDHASANFPTDCIQCHTEDAWLPATFDHDGQYFPIYSGEHEGEWTQCIECHINPSDYSVFSCIVCHLNPATDDNHIGIGGYVYEDNACLACHPTGSAMGGFDHNTTNFPLTGAHTSVGCTECHTNGYPGTPTDCNSCHNDDYVASANPSHTALNLSSDCISCHTTDAGWAPATFDIHDTYWQFTGAHIPIANDCVQCHNGDYNNTPNTCAGCHTPDYNGTTNPNHQTLNLPTDCATCHTTDAGWSPASFDIHDTYWPITGAHLPIAGDCIQCHNGDYNNTPNTCAGCHTPDYNSATNPNHISLNIPTDCASCHTTDPDWMPATFDIHDNYYPLNGAHALISNQCATCHNGDYNNTPNTCIGCHQADFDGTSNPDHNDAGFSNACLDCHNETAWSPSTFDHASFYPLNGAHAIIANDCNACHSGGYVNTPNTCIGCHQSDYDGTTNPDHSSAGFPTDCIACHNEDAWIPSTFDHDGMYFPIYSGKHDNEWNQCIECHTTPNNYTLFSCIDCHEHDDPVDMLDKHQGVSGYVYQSTACYACHPTGED